MGKRIEIKCVQPYFEEVWMKRKMFEIRYNDRDYKVGDTVVMKEWDGEHLGGVYCGREIYLVITYILEYTAALKDNYIVFGFFEIGRK
jgi:hypothetical protein